MACHYCEEGADPYKFHGVCHAEFFRRCRAGKCPRCGERESGIHGVRCNKCTAMDDPPFAGYPPGAKWCDVSLL